MSTDSLLISPNNFRFMDNLFSGLFLATFWPPFNWTDQISLEVEVDNFCVVKNGKL